MKTLSYCGEFSQKTDPQRFFLTLLAPSGAQDPLWALLAFNQEIAKTREVVTTTTIGLIRLQWWRDAIEKIYAGEVADHEVIRGLAQAIRSYELPQDLFDALLYAREFDLEDRLPGDMNGLVNYADFTGTPLLKLCLLVLGGSEDPRALATAYGLTGLLRAVLYHAGQRRCYLPEDKMASLSLAQLYVLKPQPGLSEILRDVAGTAEKLLKQAQPRTPFSKGLHKLTALNLAHFQACAHDPFNPRWIDPPAFWQLRVAVKAKLL